MEAWHERKEISDKGTKQMLRRKNWEFKPFCFGGNE